MKPLVWVAVLILMGLPLFFLFTSFGPGTSRSFPDPASPCFGERQGTLHVYPRIEVKASSAYFRASEKETELAGGKFLIASRELIDFNFSQTVVLLIEYGPNGAMGLIINRPTEARLSELLPDIEELAHREENLFIGGPVARNQLLMLIRSDREIEGTHLVFEDVYVSTSRTVLEEMANRSGKGESFRIYAGYAGWAPGQLDQEFSRGDWHVLRADKETLFEKESSQIWNELIRWFAGQWVEIRSLLIS
jgi:putative transcriptional regulator